MPAEMDFSAQQAAIAELTQRKQELMYELTSYQNTRSSSTQVRGRWLVGAVVVAIVVVVGPLQALAARTCAAAARRCAAGGLWGLCCGCWWGEGGEGFLAPAARTCAAPAAVHRCLGGEGCKELLRCSGLLQVRLVEMDVGTLPLKLATTIPSRSSTTQADVAGNLIPSNTRVESFIAINREWQAPAFLLMLFNRFRGFA